jgi:uncharacterized protein involved in exopolysaccharide biosynthesis
MFEPRQKAKSAVIGPTDTARAVGLEPFAGIDFRRIWSLLWRRKATILAATIVALAAALLLTALVPSQYTAVTQILIDPINLRAVDNELTPVNQMNDAAVPQLESQVRVLGSDNVLRRVIVAEKLDQDAEFIGAPSSLRALVNRLMAAFGLSTAPGPADRTLAALNELQRHVKVKRAERTYVTMRQSRARAAKKPSASPMRSRRPT